MERYKPKSQKNALKLLAEKYNDHYGSILKETAKQQNNLKTIPFTPRLDKIVEGLIAEDKSRKKQRKNLYRNLSIVAASILLVIVTPLIINQRKNNLTNNPATGGFAEEFSAENADDTMLYDSVKSSQSEEIGADYTSLNFSIPENLSIVNVNQDIGETIYQLNDKNHDNIVMILSEANNDENEEKEMDFQTIRINNKDVLAKSTTDYNIILFTQDNIMYKLTCKYDINTLINFGESILV